MSHRIGSMTLGRRAAGGAVATAFLFLLLLLALAADGLVAMKATAATSTADGERYSLSGSSVAIFNLAGEVKVEAGRGTAVEVYVETGGPDAGELRVETGTVRSRETLRVLYPSDEVVYPPMGRGSRTQLRVAEDGTFNDQSFERGFFDGRRRVQISGSGRGLEAHANLRVVVPRGQKIAVFLATGSASVSNVDGDLTVDVSSASIRASGTRGRLMLDSGSGSLDVADAEGDITLDTGSGDVDVSNIHGTRLLVDTGSGSITGNGLAVEDLNMDTGSGGIEVSGVDARTVRLDTGSGSVRVSLNGDPDDVSIDTGSGSVTVYLPRSAGAEIMAETGSGGIDSELPITIRSKSRDALHGTIGNGRGKIYVETGSGSIRLAALERSGR